MTATDAGPAVDELQELQDELAYTQRELTRFKDLHVRRERELKAWSERISSAHRAAWEDGHRTNLQIALEMWALAAQGSVNKLLYRAAHLPDRPKIDAVEGLRAAAEQANQALQVLTQHEEKPAAVALRQNVEVARLRRYVRHVAQSLVPVEGHQQLGGVLNGASTVGCTCAACELVAGMDQFEIEVPS